MIAAEPHRSRGHKGAHVQGWIISVLLHGTVAFTAVLLVDQVHVVPKNEAFKWNVAMVSPTQQVQPTASAQNQASTRSVPSRSAPSTTSTPFPPAQQTMSAQTPSSPQPPAQQTTPPILERAAATPELPEPLAATPAQLTPPSLATAHITQSPEPNRYETVAPMVADPTSIVKPPDPSTTVSAESDILTSPSDQAPMQMAAISPAPSNAQTKRDYGWLSEAILRRVDEFKRYPASARVDRAEGKVVVKAVINEDGDLGEVEVLQSSGYPTLDKAAVETMRQAAPFHLPHPLGQPRMTIKIPMSYRLDR